MRAVLLIAVLLSLVVATAPASAGVRYPGQRPAASPLLDRMLEAGLRFWAGRGVAMPCPEGVALDVANDLSGTDRPGWTIYARAWYPWQDGGCRIVFDGDLAGDRLAAVASPRRARFERREAARELCKWMTHELGHVAGLEHTPTGLMAERMSVAPVPWVTPRVWSRCWQTPLPMKSLGFISSARWLAS